jgi:hypothetical protein
MESNSTTVATLDAGNRRLEGQRGTREKPVVDEVIVGEDLHPRNCRGNLGRSPAATNLLAVTLR